MDANAARTGNLKAASASKSDICKEDINLPTMKETDLFQITMNALNDGRLTENLMYQKMVSRLEAFYV
jgi:hypothetical protein